jgi:hypothetical protein
VNPVHHRQSPAGHQNPPRLFQEHKRLLAVQNVKQHRITDAAVGKAATFGDEIPVVDAHVSKILGLGFCCSHHLRLDIQGVDDALNHLGGGDRERAVTAAEVDHIAAVRL